MPPYPSVRELAVDAFWELSGWDGRFMTTVRALFNHPGMLTREFLEGRRARYISPVRLYLMASLVYFLIAAAAPDISLEEGKSLFIGVRPMPTATVSRPQAVANGVNEAVRNPQMFSATERDSLLAQIGDAPRIMQPFLRRAVEDPSRFKRDMREAMPKMLFALLPIFALIVAVFYRGRKYPEHLYFAIHLHAFVFFALSLTAAARFPQSAEIAFVVGLANLAWIFIYAVLAFRRTYGETMVRTLAKGVAIGAIYGATSVAAFVLTLYAVTLRG